MENIIEYNNKQWLKAKLVLVNTHDEVLPMFISETLPISSDDDEVYNIHFRSVMPNLQGYKDNSSYLKILALPENIPTDLKNKIINGIIRFGEIFYIECEVQLSEFGKLKYHDGDYDSYEEFYNALKPEDYTISVKLDNDKLIIPYQIKPKKETYTEEDMIAFGNFLNQSEDKLWHNGAMSYNTKQLLDLFNDENQ